MINFHKWGVNLKLRKSSNTSNKSTQNLPQLQRPPIDVLHHVCRSDWFHERMVMWCDCTCADAFQYKLILSKGLRNNFNQKSARYKVRVDKACMQWKSMEFRFFCHTSRRETTQFIQWNSSTLVHLKVHTHNHFFFFFEFWRSQSYSWRKLDSSKLVRWGTR